MNTFKNISCLKGQKHMKNNCCPSVLVHTNLPGNECDKILPIMAWKQSSGMLRTFSVVGPDTTYIFICRYLPPRLAEKGVWGDILRREETDVGTEHTNTLQW